MAWMRSSGDVRAGAPRVALLLALAAAPAAAIPEEKDPAAARAEAATLVEAFRKEPGRRRSLALDLGELGPPAGAAIPVLAAAAAGDREEDVRINAIGALGRIAGPRYAPAVRPFTKEYIAKYYPPTEDRTANADPLVKTALPVLRKALGDKSEEVRINAVFAIGCMEELAADAAPLLARVLLKDGDPRVRRNAIWALTKVPGTAKAVLPALQETTRSKDAHFRRTAILAMGWFGKEAGPALPDILKAMEAEPAGQKGNHLDILDVIAGMEEAAAPAVAKVATLLDSKDPLLSSSAAWCLGKIRVGVLPHLPRLIALLGSPDEYPRWNAAWAIGRLGPDAKAALPELRRVAEGDPLDHVRANALQAVSLISGVAVPTGTDAPEPKGSGAGGAITVSSGDYLEIRK